MADQFHPDAKELGPWGCLCKSLHYRITGSGCEMCNPEAKYESPIERAAVKRVLKRLRNKIETRSIDLRNRDSYRLCMAHVHKWLQEEFDHLEPDKTEEDEAALDVISFLVDALEFYATPSHYETTHMTMGPSTARSALDRTEEAREVMQVTA